MAAAEPALTALPCSLADLGVLAVRGADARTFLQGQLSNDTARLTPGAAQLSAFHNPQGRTICVVRLVMTQPDEILAVLPVELLAPTITRLRKFVLRAKVTLTDDSAAWRVCGFPADANALPAGAFSLEFAASGKRTLALCRASVASGEAMPRACDAWRLGDIEAGLPQVYATTSEAFVAQMLNLDVLGGIAFDKGCYTGQEVIARAHYRGRVKRRMQRFETRAPAKLVPGSKGRLQDGRTFTVVDCAALADGRAQFLAVAAFAEVADDADATPGEDAGATLDCASLPLPYALPG